MTAAPEGEGERTASPLVDAITAVLRYGLPGEPPPTRSSVDLILGTQPSDVGSLSRQVRSGYMSALIWSELQNGRARHAVELADRKGMEQLRRVAGQAPPASQAAGYSVMSTAYLATGRCRDGAACARIAVEYAREAGDDASQFHARSLLAASLAMNGEFTAAETELAVATDLASDSGWDLGAWPLVLANVLVNFRNGNSAAIGATLECVAGAGSDDDVVARNVSRICRIWLHASREEHQEMVVAARSIALSVDRDRCPPFLIDVARSLECLALIHLGEVGTAWALISGHQSPPGHGVCYELHRAAIHLRMGEPRQALRATEACVNDCPDHNLRTLPSILLRRAVAYEQLGRLDAADAEFSRCAHLAAEFGAVSPSVGLPHEALMSLYARLLVREPEFGSLIAKRLPVNGDFTAPEPLGFVPVHLTGREAVLSRWLATALTLAEIAENLHVSVNTVKTQVRTLYRKLGVTTREDAVSSLERAGQYTAKPHRGPGSGAR